ncbi:MAG: phosphate ABC transporter substrate-binding protein [Ruthenibacterium sp.]
MKKQIAIVLALTLCLGTLAGCGAASSTTPQNTAPASSAAAPAAPALSGKLSLGGSTSVEKVVQAMMEAYMAENPGVTITYAPTGSGTGIQGASDGTLDIGLSSRSLKDEEKAKFTETTFALDGIAVIVNNENAVADLDLETLAKIYKGEITNWKEVGGKDGEIVPIGRDAASGTRDGFESIVNVKEECVYAEEQASTGAVIASVQSNAGAIGYVSLSAVGDTVKALTIDGIVPSEESVKDGSYKIQRPFVFAVQSAKASDAAKAFLDWAVSANTTELVKNAGAVPVA